MFLVKSAQVDITSIIVENRQRTEIDEDKLQALMSSIGSIGLINPIIIDSGNRLIAGERRLRACAKLGWDKILVRYNNTLDEKEKQLIELEENIKRVDLSWKDQVAALRNLHNLYCGLDPEWTLEKTSQVVSLDPGTVSTYLNIANELNSGNKIVAGAGKLSEAKTALSRARRKEKENVINTIFEDPKSEKASAPEVTDDRPVICGDFIQWSKTPQKNKFDVIHCDFPYGVNMDKSGQVAGNLGLYEDSPDVYFALLEAFTKNYHNFAQPVSHIMFWFSMNFYSETREALSTIPGARVFPFPLIWYKDDGKGMMPDSMREGRRVYETAFHVSVGDRTIRKAVGNAFPHGLDATRDHQARKPPAMLQHFFQMYLEPGCRLLDPTCGSGAALVAGRALGAEVLGIELDPEYVERIKL
ncbi:MAG: hypothetical protein B7Z37_03015 [Verrucomicrobia bacterium 12-59-8]|nr:MAG: hypothetical protein B7Z37_03015 [Verrucomicrobia bacterium 12-59-8]